MGMSDDNIPEEPSTVRGTFNRQLKFRVWNGKTKSWIYGPNVNPSLDGVNLFGETILFGEFMNGISLDELNECEALQFTGLLDKNNKEVFEGDILKVWVGNDLQRSYYLVKDIREFYSDCNRDDAYLNITKFEIIGNIFENPELLNESKTS